ncbi:G-protein coupled receptor 135-like [Lineus longissimus]|uniref:G-protein coupled receptor 135-like n=1 Tax=Lineus longissimus TaxID=88925 RepID=UPI00315CB91E
MSALSFTIGQTTGSPGVTTPTWSANADNTLCNVIKAVLIIIIFVISSLGNSTVLYIICKNYQMRTVTNALVVSLSVSDLITTWLCMPFTVISLIMDQWPFGEIFCIINGFLSSVSCIGSTLMITLISVDRLISVIKAPGGTLTARRAAVSMFFVWLCATVFSLPWYLIETAETKPVIYMEGYNHCMYLFHVRSSKFGLVYTSVTISMCFGIPCILMLYCFGAIFRTIRTNDKQIRPASSQAQSLIFQSEMRTATTVLIMIAMVTVCWLPYLIMALLEATTDILMTSTTDAIALIVTWTIRAMNPYLYAVRNPNVQEMLNIKQTTGCRSKSFTNILPATPRPEPEQYGNVVSEENVKPRFDWTIVKRSPLSPRALFCGARKGSDEDALQVASTDGTLRQSTSL